jgi:hypothetical protein
MSLFQKFVLALQLVSLLGAELAKAVAPGGTATLPPESVSGLKVTVEGAQFELRLLVKRLA